MEMGGLLAVPKASSDCGLTARELALDEVVGLELQKLLVRTRLHGGSWATLKKDLLSGAYPENFVAAIRRNFAKRGASPRSVTHGASLMPLSRTSSEPYSVSRVMARRPALRPKLEGRDTRPDIHGRALSNATGR